MMDSLCRKCKLADSFILCEAVQKQIDCKVDSGIISYFSPIICFDPLTNCLIRLLLSYCFTSTVNI